MVIFHDGQSDVEPANFAGSGSLARGRLIVASKYSVGAGVWLAIVSGAKRGVSDATPAPLSYLS